VPDLAPAVRILDLARALKQASADVPIVETGLRPGERLSEELWRDSEVRVPTSQSGPFRIRGPRVHEQDIERWIGQLGTIVERRDVAALRAKLCEIVPEYQPSAEFLAAAGLRAPSR
jgi:FlaA1/EpsC-like NDP-sugar epimerase